MSVSLIIPDPIRDEAANLHFDGSDLQAGYCVRELDYVAGLALEVGEFGLPADGSVKAAVPANGE